MDRILFRWLGVAGIELTYKNQVLLIDPYLTRIPFWRQWIGAVQPDQELVREIIPRADFVLITHAHYDHILDVPVLMKNTGAQALGSPNSIELLKILGMPTKQIRQVAGGDQFELGEFYIEVIASHHFWAPGFAPGPLRPGMHPPLQARDYRMDTCFSYRITINDTRLLVSSGDFMENIPSSDVLFANPVFGYAHDPAFLKRVHPRLVIPIHWDNFWRPLNKTVRPIIRPPSWKIFPPLQLVDLQKFSKDIALILPETKTLIPERLHIYNFIDWL